MSRSSPWRTSWRGSPGRCRSVGNRLTPTRYPWPRRDLFARSESAGRASGVCERVTTRWPDSQTVALRKPGVENGAETTPKEFYEDRGARYTPSWPGGDLRGRIQVLKQTLISRRSRQTPCRRGRDSCNAVINLATLRVAGLREWAGLGDVRRNRCAEILANGIPDIASGFDCDRRYLDLLAQHQWRCHRGRTFFYFTGSALAILLVGV